MHEKRRKIAHRACGQWGAHRTPPVEKPTLTEKRKRGPCHLALSTRETATVKDIPTGIAPKCAENWVTASRSSAEAERDRPVVASTSAARWDMPRNSGPPVDSG